MSDIDDNIKSDLGISIVNDKQLLSDRIMYMLIFLNIMSGCFLIILSSRANIVGLFLYLIMIENILFIKLLLLVIIVLSMYAYINYMEKQKSKPKRMTDHMLLPTDDIDNDLFDQNQLVQNQSVQKLSVQTNKLSNDDYYNMDMMLNCDV